MKIRFSGKSQNLIDAGYSLKEQAQVYEDTLKDVYNNARWYLDTLEFMRSYRVSWKTYRGKKITLPYRYSKTYKENQ